MQTSTKIAKALNNLSLIEESSLEHGTSRSPDELVARQSPPPKPKGYRWELPPELELTPVPGYRFVDRETYDQIMGDKSKQRVSVNLPERRDSILL